MKTSEARNVIYLDIETGPGGKPRLDSIKADGRLTDPVKIAIDLDKKQDEAWRKQALSSIHGEVFCVGLAVDDSEAFCLRAASGEKETLEMFDEWLENFSFPTVVGHNLKEFDALFLFHKGLKYGLLNIISLFDGTGPTLVDTMLLMNGPAWKTMVSLDNMSKLLLGESAKGDITGADVHDLILAGEYDKITNYCISDVNILRRCHKRLNELGIYSS